MAGRKKSQKVFYGCFFLILQTYAYSPLPSCTCLRIFLLFLTPKIPHFFSLSMTTAAECEERGSKNFGKEILLFLYIAHKSQRCNLNSKLEQFSLMTKITLEGDIEEKEKFYLQQNLTLKWECMWWKISRFNTSRKFLIFHPAYEMFKSFTAKKNSLIFWKTLVAILNRSNRFLHSLENKSESHNSRNRVKKFHYFNLRDVLHMMWCEWNCISSDDVVAKSKRNYKIILS